MANFDPNRWYQIILKVGDGQSLDGSVLFDHGTGSVFLKNTDTTNAEEQWQIFPYNATYYVLRTKASGAQGYMAVAVNANETTLGETVPVMRNSTLSDNSMFWQIGPWGDGTFFFTNGANGSAWHLLVKSNDLMAMSSNITKPQDEQSFLFNPLGKVNDAAFSSVIVWKILKNFSPKSS